MSEQIELDAAQQLETESHARLRVRQVTYEAEGVISLVLERADGGVLPAWQPGSHIDLLLPSGLVRQYSLCGDLSDTRSYKIAVLLERASRGGSLELHESGLVGRDLEIHGPRNRFHLVDAGRYQFIAGGIGLTPILPMIQRAVKTGTPWDLNYGGRTRAHMAFLDDLRHCTGGTIDLRPEDEFGLLDLKAIIESVTPGTEIYACGPSAMLASLEDLCREHNISATLHIERFTHDERDTVNPLADESDEFASFEVELVRQGQTIVVPPDRTVLRSIREVTQAALFSCEEGYCGTCETRVLEGIPDHRDTYLTDDEKAENKTMMTCVSRAKTSKLVLDI